MEGIESAIIDALHTHGHLRLGDLYERVYGTPAQYATWQRWFDLLDVLERLVADGRIVRHDGRFGSAVTYGNNEEGTCATVS